ncbi:hypothetical protein [Lentibacillus persicus]|uniref:hypothetical protein n=1 Tax=Lentibacillus persicus TaxID=640948 RepID=UPI000B7F50BF|nr:hypothetical protein [Lentibacillus persicus]
MGIDRRAEKSAEEDGYQQKMAYIDRRAKKSTEGGKISTQECAMNRKSSRSRFRELLQLDIYQV